MVAVVMLVTYVLELKMWGLLRYGPHATLCIAYTAGCIYSARDLSRLVAVRSPWPSRTLAAGCGLSTWGFNFPLIVFVVLLSLLVHIQLARMAEKPPKLTFDDLPFRRGR